MTTQTRYGHGRRLNDRPLFLERFVARSNRIPTSPTTRRPRRPAVQSRQPHRNFVGLMANVATKYDFIRVSILAPNGQGWNEGNQQNAAELPSSRRARGHLQEVRHRSLARLLLGAIERWRIPLESLPPTSREGLSRWRFPSVRRGSAIRIIFVRT
jgi:hypothetical protein